jgi:hypothetical protein
MGEPSDLQHQQSFFKKHWEGFTEFWGDRFSFVENYARFLRRDKPIPSWSDSDVQEFIASDHIHGPTVLFPSLSFYFFRTAVDLA